MKKSISLLGVALISSTVLLGVSSVSAATPDSPKDNAKTPISANLTADESGENPTPPDPVDPDHPDNGGNKPLNPSGNFGIAYIPSKFDFGSNELNVEGEQIIELANGRGKSSNVGVKDTTHGTKGWTLNASLKWDGTEMTGASIKTGNNSGNVSLNDNGKLETEQNVVGTKNAVIDTTGVNIMTASSGNVYSGTYDYDLGDIKLVIPDASKVAAASYTGNVNWDLSVAP